MALAAMGGRDRLQKIGSVRLETVGHTLLMEQSYRQDPFITSYERTTTTIDLTNQRVLTDAKLTWPESDNDQAESESTVVIGPQGGVRRAKSGDLPCSLAQQDEARETLALGPARLLLTAAQATDLHFDSPETLRSTPHSVLAFTWQGHPVRVLVNRDNHLPDAMETTRTFHDFWYFWGDVKQRVYFDNWKLQQGVVYPTNLVEERNGSVWRSTQAIKLEFNVSLDGNAFRMDPAVVQRSAAAKGWDFPFSPKNDTKLADGLDLFLGPWNATIVQQPDGIVILEAPISESYTKGVIAEARRRYPNLPVKAVLSTSDSWPHTGGVRYAVSQGYPVYILDLNQSLLDRMVAAPHTLTPDTLELTRHAHRPDWKIVAGKVTLGSGPNRMELYPLRGASTERQYMVYFPEHHLLYASDTLVLNDDNTLYDPELAYEVSQAVKREHLDVDTVFAMHQAPVAWKKVMDLLSKSL
ncbi:MAG TPA: hypothetical protein VFQ00_12370 [Terriglobales bacterium]|nr:hypothetical protein [Terriglobales bacterium]